MLPGSSGGDGEDDGMYASFFNPKPAGRWNRRGEEYDEERSWHEDESDGEGGEEARAAAGCDRWDGDALFDTGEGRDTGVRPTLSCTPPTSTQAAVCFEYRDRNVLVLLKSTFKFSNNTPLLEFLDPDSEHLWGRSLDPGRACLNVSSLALSDAHAALRSVCAIGSPMAVLQYHRCLWLPVNAHLTRLGDHAGVIAPSLLSPSQ